MAKRTDANQAQIVAGLRQFGASVVDLHNVGHGCPDIIVGHHNKNFLLEVKCANGVLTPAEIEFRDSWRGSYYIVRSIEDALQIICDDMEE
jgi:hypothetical protein